MTSVSKQVTLARSVIDCRCHVCGFFDRSEDQHEVMLPFTVEGLSSGDNVIQLIDRHDKAERMRMLIESGIDADAAERDGRLNLIEWEDAYLRDGHFDQHAMLKLAEEIGATRTRADSITRVWADMRWAARGAAGADDLVEYECRLNHVLPSYDLTVVCAYDVSSFNGSVLWNVLRVHPYVIIERKLVKNPLYLPPDEYLARMRGLS
jgi:DcmR-like sensory protein